MTKHRSDTNFKELLHITVHTTDVSVSRSHSCSGHRSSHGHERSLQDAEVEKLLDNMGSSVF